MKKRFLLVIIFLIFVLSTVTFFLVLYYLDPYLYKELAYSSILITGILGLSSLLSIILYIIKKIYFRGRVGIYHVLTSFRQGAMFSFFLFGLVVFQMFEAPLFFSGSILFFFFLFLELFLQNLKSQKE